MTHTALVDDVLFWLVIAMALLLVMFIYAVITAPPQGAPPAELPALEWPAPELPAPVPALPARWPLAPVSPAGAAGLSGDAGYAAQHAPAAAPVNSPAKVSSGLRWGPAGASILVSSQPGIICGEAGAGGSVVPSALARGPGGRRGLPYAHAGRVPKPRGRQTMHKKPGKHTRHRMRANRWRLVLRAAVTLVLLALWAAVVVIGAHLVGASGP